MCKYAHSYKCSRYVIGNIEYRAHQKFTCNPLPPHTNLRTLSETKAKCNEDPSCKIINELDLQDAYNDYRLCPPTATIEKIQNSYETIHIKDMMGNTTY